MFTTEITHALGPADLSREVAWERAAQLLDLDAGVIRRLRHPQMESVSHLVCQAGAALLHIAMGPLISSGDCVASVAVGCAVSSTGIAAASQEMLIEAALGGLDGPCAAVGLRLPSSRVKEHDLCQMACESAPVVSRILGNTRLLPVDLASAGAAQWMSHAAAQFRMKLEFSSADPSEYCSLQDAAIAKAIVAASSFALDQIGRKLRGAAVTIIGSGALARRSVAAFHQANARIVAVADQSGALVQNSGVEVASLLRHMERGGLLVEYSGAEHALHADAIGCPADVLLLETQGTEITGNNSSAVKAPIVIESSGLSFDARESLSTRGVLVIPREITHCVRLFPRSRGLYGEEQATQLFSQLWREIDTLAKSHRIPPHSAVLALASLRFAQQARAARP